MIADTDYSIFFEFIKNYSGSGFREINNHDQIMVRLNRSLDSRRQFFYIADVLKLLILYTSPQVLDIFGIEPEKYDFSYNLSKTHRTDIERRSRARAKLIEKGQDLFITKTEPLLISSNFRISNLSGEYLNVLVQCYLFYSNSPVETTYVIVINTPIKETLSKMIKRGHYHWYSGNNMTYFRYPDEELVLTGSNLSLRELEVLKNIHMGMGSKEIGEKLSLSLHTINTHRRNILKKSGKSSIGEVIFEQEHIGMI
jgi:DNA-binding CsgD family transcriptional regulator